MDSVVQKLPIELVRGALKRKDQLYWRVEDIPTVIEAARQCGLSSVGGSLFLFGQDGTASSEVGTCECYWVRVSVDAPLGKDWAFTVDEAAQEAQKQFAAMRAKYDFHKEGLSFPSVQAYQDKGGRLDDIMYFEWSMDTEDAHRRFEDRIKSGSIRTTAATPPEWGCLPPVKPQPK